MERKPNANKIAHINYNEIIVDTISTPDNKAKIYKDFGNNN